LEAKTGSLATTGSNTFIGTQTITGSLYISSDLIVQGSSSLQNITASAVSIGTNIVNLNTANPAVRYAGLSIGDSGSIGSSGSFLYDSVQDEFIFVHRGANTTVTSSVVLMGPQTYDSIGSETYLTSNRIPKGAGNEHLADSNISDDGTTIKLTLNTEVTGSFKLTSNLTFGLTGDRSIGWGGNTQSAAANPVIYSDNNYLALNSKAGSKLYLNYDNTNASSTVDFFNSKVVVKSNGYVGIGITNPSYTLDVNGSVRYTGNLLISKSNDATVEVNSTTAASYSAFFHSESGTAKAYWEYVNSAFSDSTRRNYLEAFNLVGGFSVYTAGAKALDITTSGAATFSSTLSATTGFFSSNVIIDNQSLNNAKYLQFDANISSGAAASLGDIRWYNKQWDSSIKAQIIALTDTDITNGRLSFRTGTDGVNATERLRISSTGASTFFSPSASNGVSIKGGGNGGTFPFRVTWASGAEGDMLLVDDDGRLRVGNAPVPTTGGFTNTRVAIKQSADGGSGGGLHIEQASNTNVAFFGFNGSLFRIGTSYRSTGNYTPIEFTTNAASRLYIETNGNIGINDNNPQTRLSVNGANYVEMATFTATAASAASIVSADSGYVEFSNGEARHNSNSGVFSATTNGIQILKAGIVQVTVSQDITTTGSTGYIAMYIRKNGNNISENLITNTNGHWDGINGVATATVSANDVIGFFYSGPGITAFDAGSWSQYSFIWTSR
jgi:hypothetical protein